MLFAWFSTLQYFFFSILFLINPQLLVGDKTGTLQSAGSTSGLRWTYSCYSWCPARKEAIGTEGGGGAAAWCQALPLCLRCLRREREREDGRSWALSARQAALPITAAWLIHRDRSREGDPGAYTGRSACGPWGAHEAWVTKGASAPPLISSSDLSGESVLQPFCPRWSLVHFLPGRFRNVPFAPQHTHPNPNPNPAHTRRVFALTV